MLSDTILKYKNTGREYLSLNEAFSSCELNFSFPQNLHSNSINVVFYDGLCYFVLRGASCLDAFSAYLHNA